VRGRVRPFAAWSLLAGAIVLGACADRVSDPSEQVPGDALAGREQIEAYGCGACHNVPGIASADSLVAPPLDGWAHRRTIAGRIANTPANLAAWLENPQEIDPGNAMPDMGVSPEDARDMAAYLYTLR
jgi:cytochrome c